MTVRFIGAVACAAVLALGLAGARPAAAGTVTGTYTGHVTGVDAPLNSTIAVNDAFSFSFSYDDTMTDAYPADPTFAQYPGNTISGSGSIGSFNFTVTSNPSNLVAVVNQPGNDRFGFAIVGLSGAVVSGYTPVGFSMELGTTNDVLATDALPTSYVLASLFQNRSFSLSFTDDPEGLNPVQHYSFVSGTIATTTPIPAALPLFASALAGLGWAGWRRRRAV